MKINILDAKVFNRISAGEVVEKPYSVVKELVENSIDAGATVISVEIEEGGIKKIVVSDNGSGILKDDLTVAFLPHATSKIKDVEDLDEIATLGFRGEALASIASVCHVTLSSRVEGEDVGYYISVDGGHFGPVKEIARNKGTTLEVNDLFYNTPVRAKFLRKPKTEEGEITHLMQKFMLAHPEISFSYIVDGKQVYNTISSELADVIYTIYGKEVYDNLLKVDYSENDLRLVGYVVSPKYTKPNRSYQTLFVNDRYVENYLISTAIQGVFEPFLMKGKFPLYVLNLVVPKDSVDVNVHPTKKEVKFENQNMIFGFVRRAIEHAIAGVDHVATLDLFDRDDPGVVLTQGFDHIEVSKLEPLSPLEGSSYRKKIDNKELIDIKVSDIVEKPWDEDKSKIKEKEVKSNLPNFEDVKLNETQNKMKSGRLFFDQKGENYSYNDFKRDNREKLFKSTIKDEIKVVGAVFNTYVITELEDSVFIIDQHAAHERQLYDKLVKRIDNEKVVKQTLLIPYSFTVNEKENEVFEDIVPYLSELGFEISCKNKTYQINTIPLVLEKINLKDFVDDILATSFVWKKSPAEIIKDKLAQNACKHAIKGGDDLPKDYLADLVEQMKNGELLCPHGRPIVLEVTKKDFEKLFKRIV